MFVPGTGRRPLKKDMQRTNSVMHFIIVNIGVHNNNSPRSSHLPGLLVTGTAIVTLADLPVLFVGFSAISALWRLQQLLQFLPAGFKGISVRTLKVRW